MHYKTKRRIFISQTQAFWTLVSLIAIFIVSYAYLVNITVLNTAARQHAEEMITETRSAISQLELELIDTNRSLNREYATMMGLSQVEDLVFIERSNTMSLSLNEDR